MLVRTMRLGLVGNSHHYSDKLIIYVVIVVDQLFIEHKKNINFYLNLVSTVF